MRHQSYLTADKRWRLSVTYQTVPPAPLRCGSFVFLLSGRNVFTYSEHVVFQVGSEIINRMLQLMRISMSALMAPKFRLQNAIALEKLIYFQPSTTYHPINLWQVWSSTEATIKNLEAQENQIYFIQKTHIITDMNIFNNLDIRTHHKSLKMQFQRRRCWKSSGGGSLDPLLPPRGDPVRMAEGAQNKRLGHCNQS